MNNNNTTILIADDHRLLRESLALLINLFNGFEVIGEVSNGEEVINYLEKENIPHIIMLDLNMPKMNGFDTANILQKRYPDVKVIVLTMHDSESVILELINLGVKAILKKDVHRSELEKVLLGVANSQNYYSGDELKKLADFG